MADVIEFEKKEKTFKDKWKDFKANVKVKTQITCDWCRENKEVLLVVVPAVIGAVGEVGKAAIKAKDRREERELEMRKLDSMYDRSLGAYVDTTHTLTTKEKRDVQKRKRAKGMTTTEALEDLGLLDV